MLQNAAYYKNLGATTESNCNFDAMTVTTSLVNFHFSLDIKKESQWNMVDFLGNILSALFFEVTEILPTNSHSSLV